MFRGRVSWYHTSMDPCHNPTVGTEAALFSFKSAGLSQPHSCAGAVGQQP